LRRAVACLHVGWRDMALPLLLAIAALTLSMPRLATPTDYVFDEIYYAYTASKYVSGTADAYRWDVPPRNHPTIEWTHPPVAKLLIAGGIRIFGDNPIGWRAVSVLFGAIGIIVTFLLARRLTGDRGIAALAAGLLLLDGLYLVESRTGMSNLFLLVFANAALLAFSRVLTLPAARVAPSLLATGTLLGLAIATKWSAVALLGLIGLAYCWRGVRIRRASPRLLSAYVRWAPVAFVALPAGIYLLSYGHFFLTGHDWGDFVALHRAMLTYHRDLGVVHPYSSAWWEWPLAARPVWYYAHRDPGIGSFVFVNCNPWLYWPMIVAVAWVAVDWWRRRPEALTVLGIGFFGQWLPWAFSPRGTFIYHFLPAVPLGCVALAVVLSDAWQRGGWRRCAAAVYVIGATATFAFFYPLATAMPLTPDQVAQHLWFDSWR
jgi:dolichyl-phosphate-mannose--protein O-mannosyl transferase